MHASLASSLTGTWRGHFDVPTCDINAPPPVDTRACGITLFYGTSTYVTLSEERGTVTGTFGGGTFRNVPMRGQPKGNRATLDGQYAASDLKQDINATVELLTDGTLAIHVDTMEQRFDAFYGHWVTTHIVFQASSLPPQPATP